MPRTGKKPLAMLFMPRRDIPLQLAYQFTGGCDTHSRINGSVGRQSCIRHLLSIPPMTKTDLLANFDEIVTDRRLSLDRCRNFLQGEVEEGGYLYDRYQVSQSGGSSGVPALTVFSWLESARQWAAFVRSLRRWAGRTGRFKRLQAVDRNGKPVVPGQRAEKVYCTPLFRHTLPLLRYELTDQFVLSADRPGCGSGFQLIANVEGRLEDYFRYDGGIEISPDLFKTVLGRESAVFEYQVSQTREGVHIVLTSSRPINVDHRISEICSQNDINSGTVNKATIPFNL
jgi:hypothetical protein